MSISDPKPILSDDEMDDFNASENGELVSVGDIEERRAFWREASKQTLDGQRKRISISIPERDLARLKTKAAEKGLPYQSLINSILHEFVES